MKYWLKILKRVIHIEGVVGGRGCKRKIESENVKWVVTGLEHATRYS
jgi:hypothetical protein